ncbi:MAG: undecaprenyldiphospho-muramoylpentapeptide beta-N-acetylglucosaminyltransferase [Dysgonomonas sp.]|nr:undecaprenyldiphospho-muramoylpentapeptide beta-N-acetylglucosaminyltransferase [Dysgonomonas sp.]
MKPLKVIISGGGTGGHIFPAISIANAVKRRYPDAEILFVGAEDRMEMSRIPEAGYNIVGLPVAGFDRKNLLKNVKVVMKLFKSLSKAKKVIKDFQPDVAIGVGGYASGPVLKIASKRGIPTLLQEQNSYAGVTNKLLAKRADSICVAYEGMETFFPQQKLILTGNPIRQDLESDILKEEAYSFFNLDPDKKTILVIGGSLGALTINQSILSNLNLLKNSNVQILWQCGKRYHSELVLTLSEKEAAKDIHLYDFINRMDLAYKVADLVISRAGASSISELCVLGKPSILVPSPNVAEDHQTKNAMALVNKDAAVMIKDVDAVSTLLKASLDLVEDEDRLIQLSDNVKKMALTDSANKIVDEIERLVALNNR